MDFGIQHEISTEAVPSQPGRLSPAFTSHSHDPPAMPHTHYHDSPATPHTQYHSLEEQEVKRRKVGDLLSDKTLEAETFDYLLAGSASNATMSSAAGLVSGGDGNSAKHRYGRHATNQNLWMPESLMSFRTDRERQMQQGQQTLQQPHPPPEPLHIESTGKSYRRISSACVNCKKKHLPCDNSRPCQRCIHFGEEVGTSTLSSSALADRSIAGELRHCSA